MSTEAIQPRALVFVIGDGNAPDDHSRETIWKFPLPCDAGNLDDVALLWGDDLVGLDRRALCYKCMAVMFAYMGAGSAALERSLPIMPGLTVREWLKGRDRRIRELASGFSLHLRAGMSTATIEDFRGLPGAKSDGNGGVMFCCPCHKDRTPSGHAWVDDAGAIAVCCLAGCEHKTLVAELEHHGLDVSNGRPSSDADNPGDYKGQPIVEFYDYFTVDGAYAYTVGRTPKNSAGEKQFPTWRRKTGGGYLWKRGDVPPVIYQAPKVAAAVKKAPSSSSPKVRRTSTPSSALAWWLPRTQTASRAGAPSSVSSSRALGWWSNSTTTTTRAANTATRWRSLSSAPVCPTWSSTCLICPTRATSRTGWPPAARWSRYSRSWGRPGTA